MNKQADLDCHVSINNGSLTVDYVLVGNGIYFDIESLDGFLKTAVLTFLTYVYNCFRCYPILYVYPSSFVRAYLQSNTDND